MELLKILFSIHVCETLNINFSKEIENYSVSQDFDWIIISSNNFNLENFLHDSFKLNTCKKIINYYKSIFLKNNNESSVTDSLTELGKLIDNQEFISSLENHLKIVLAKLKNDDPQYEMNGFNNIWIVKPVGLSRGRGIKLINNLTEANEIINGKMANFVIQKYIENPLLILERKVQ